METFNKSEFKENTMKIIKGSVIAIIATLLLLFLFAIVLTYTPISESTIKPIVTVITAISIFIGSTISTLKIKKKGLLNGGAVGTIYILTIYLISSITGSGFTLNLYSAIMIIASVIAGMIGGIIGVNLK